MSINALNEKIEKQLEKLNQLKAQNRQLKLEKKRKFLSNKEKKKLEKNIVGFYDAKKNER